MTNKDEIFCIIGSFLNRLKAEDWNVLSQDKYRLNLKTDKLVITDRVKRRIAKELNEIYTVKGVN